MRIGGFVFDRYSAVPLFLGGGLILLAVSYWFASNLTRHASDQTRPPA